MTEVKTNIIPDELVDEELQQMGVRFTDKTNQEQPEQEVQNARWEPVKGRFSRENPFPQKLRSCGKWAAIFGGICLILQLWLRAGLLASEAAWPGMVVCALLGGLTVGYNAK